MDNNKSAIDILEYKISFWYYMSVLTVFDITVSLKQFTSSEIVQEFKRNNSEHDSLIAFALLFP